jgi:hypothetical protein
MTFDNLLARPFQIMKLDLKHVTGVGRRGFTGFLSAVCLGLATVTAGAHPGHGLSEANASHVLTSPYHLAVVAGCLVTAALTLFAGAKVVQHPAARRTLQITAACAMLAAAVTALIWR